MTAKRTVKPASKKNKNNRFLSSLLKQRWLLFAITFGIIGVATLLYTMAATKTVTYEGKFTPRISEKSFQVVASSEGTITAQVMFNRLGRATVEIRDTSGNVLATKGGRSKQTISVVVKPGTYKVFIRDDNGKSGSYKLTISYPVPDPADTTKPSTPTGLKTTVEGDSVTLNWTASTDNVKVAGYDVKRNGARVASISSSDVTYIDKAVEPGTYSYAVSAYDNSNNYSADSVKVDATIAEPVVYPSGEPMPVGDLPGWKQLFTDDFTTDVELGSFPAAVSDKWGGYPYPYRDTRGKRSTDPTVGGWHHPGKTVSIKNGVMDIWLHTELIDGVKKRLVAAPVPKINGANATGVNGVDGQLYGRYAVRFRVDPTRTKNNFDGYKTAWLLWPKSGTWPQDGEIDFPEGSLNGVMKGYLHKKGATVGSDQYWADTGTSYTSWHTAVIEWGPGRGAFYLDGALITTASGGKSEWTERIPDTPMRYIMQSETQLSGDTTPEASEGHIEIDWISIYSKN